MSLLTRDSGSSAVVPVILIIAAIWTGIHLFNGPVIDLGPRSPRIEETTQTENDPGPSKDKEPEPKGEPVPATGRSGRGPRVPDCNNVARIESTGKSTGGAPIYRLLDNKGRTLGYAHRDAKWQTNPRFDPDCEIFEFYTAKGDPLMEADCNCNDTGRSVANHKPLNL